MPKREVPTAVPDEEDGHWLSTRAKAAPAETRRLPLTYELVDDIPDLAETRVQENAEAAPSETMRQQNAGASSEENEAFPAATAERLFWGSESRAFSSAARAASTY